MDGYIRVMQKHAIGVALAVGISFFIVTIISRVHETPFFLSPMP
jgi:hypothetical protein